MAGFKSVVANELVPVYSKTYKLNHPDSDVFIGDLRNEGFHHLVNGKKYIQSNH
jgi:site-specific DNA-cytosine methylase